MDGEAQHRAAELDGALSRRGGAARSALVVLGMHRSGTSALTRVLGLMGADLPKTLMAPQEGNNEGGFWESQEVSDLNDRILAAADGRWDDWRAFDPSVLAPAVYEDVLADARRTLEAEFASSPLFVLKDPRISRLVPLYAEVFASLGVQPRYVLCNRNPMGVIASLHARNRFTDAFSSLVWLRHQVDAEADTRGKPRCFVSYESLLNDWRAVVRRIGLALDWDVEGALTANADEVDAYLSPTQRHHAPTRDDLEQNGQIPASVKDAYAAFCDLEERGDAGGADARAALDNVRVELNKSAAALGASFFNEIRARERNWVTQRTALYTQRDRLTGELVDITRAYRAGEAKRSDLARENETVKQQRDALSIQRDGLVVERNKLIEIRDGLEAERDGLIEARYLLAAERDSLLRTQDELLGERDALRVTRDNLIRDVARARREMAAARAQLDSARAERRKLAQQMLALTNSTSWRVTRPLRGIKRALTEKGFALAVVTRLRTRAIKALRIERLMRLIGVDRIMRPIRLKRAVENAKRLALEPRTVEASVQSPGWRAAPMRKLRIQEALEQADVIADPSAAALAIAQQSLKQAGAKKISVVMPAWNREATIVKALKSVFAQTLRPFEVLVADDGSTDRTIAMVEAAFALEIADGRLKILRNPHRGVSAARNAGVAAARGDLIAYLDSDNAWRPHYLEVMASAFAEADEVCTAYSGLMHHSPGGISKVLARPYDRAALIHLNFIDMNVFMHRAHLSHQLGGFREEMSRLVDWELIIRYTKNYQPAFLPFVGVDYYLGAAANNITQTRQLNLENVRFLHRPERIALGVEPLKLAYFIYDFPALSQTFVFAEVRDLLKRGADVKIYYAADPDEKAELDFEVEAYRVADADELAALFVAHERNICHSHFAYPGVTNFVRPACKKSGAYYTFMPHAVDIFHHANRPRSKVGELGADPQCLKVFVYGDHHRAFLESQGVPRRKIAYTFQAVDTQAFAPVSSGAPATENGVKKKWRVAAIGRFIEKKGFDDLIAAMAQLPEDEFELDLYGFGPLEAELRAHAQSLGVRNVTFKGAIRGAEALAEVYRQSDVLAAPCVEAQNGDIDGFPTVILEAMISGVPVVATSVSAIPDYLRDGVEVRLSPPRDPAALASALLSLKQMSTARRQAMVRRAKNLAGALMGSERTVQRLLDVWLGYSVDIVMVTFINEKYKKEAETFEIIDRILAHTSTNFTLTIVDNNSDPKFWAALVQKFRGETNVRLIRNSANVFCGPGANTAISCGTSEFAIYVCSNEGFVKEHAWERSLIEAMRTDPSAGMGGHLLGLPRHLLGEELATHPAFLRFRQREFARAHPRRAFQHVQGGLKIIRRAMFEAVGGYNNATPQDHMDVELSYVFDANGFGLRQVDTVAAVTVKTRPGVEAILDERTVAAHPLDARTVKTRLDALKDPEMRGCNVCGSNFEAFVPEEGGADSQGICPNCGASGFERLMFRLLARAPYIHREGKCAIYGRTRVLPDRVSSGMFKSVIAETDSESFAARVAGGGAYSCVIIDPDAGAWTASASRSVSAALNHGSEVIVAETERSESIEADIIAGLAKRGLRVETTFFDIASEKIGYDWRRLHRLSVADA